MSQNPEIFDKSIKRFPIRESGIYLNHCGISPLYLGAVQAGQAFAEDHCHLGISILDKYARVLDQLHEATATFLHTKKENISFLRNTAEALSMLAEMFPFAKGDEIISYVHEYPSNHYPWFIQKKRGVKLKLIANKGISNAPFSEALPCAWSLEELQQAITSRTRIIALSHVQFTSGFAADLRALAKLCKERNVDLIIDAAQSLGSLPVFPEEWGIAAVASSGWKWLLGPVGSGLLYTSPKLRDKLGFCMAGADLMQQGDDYLNLSWNPHLDGRRFEYSTVSYQLSVQLLACLDEIFNRYGIEKIWQEIRRLQGIFCAELDHTLFGSLAFPEQNRSGILSFVLAKGNVEELVKKALGAGLSVSTRGGYLRVGIHFYNTEAEVKKAAGILNACA